MPDRYLGHRVAFGDCPKCQALGAELAQRYRGWRGALRWGQYLKEQGQLLTDHNYLLANPFSPAELRGE